MSFKNRRLSLLCRFQSFCTSFPISPVTKSYNWILLHVNISGYLVLHIIFLRQNFLCVGGTTQYSWQSFSCIGRNTTRLYLSPSASLFFRTSSVLEWPEICQKMLKVQFHQILPKLTLSADNFWSLISLSCIQGIVDFDNLAWPYHYHYHGRQEMQFQTLTSLPAWSAAIDHFSGLYDIGTKSCVRAIQHVRWLDHWPELYRQSVLKRPTICNVYTCS